MQKTLRIMRLTAILLTVCCLHVTAGIQSQEVSYSGKNVKLETVFQSLEQQTGYFVMYPTGLLDGASTITIHSKKQPLSEFLKKVLEKQPFEFSIESTTIFIKKKILVAEMESSVISPLLSPPLIDVRGRVVNEKGEPVAGATVMIKGSKKATSTDVDGIFMLNGVEEKAQLIITGANIEDYEVNIKGQSLLNVTVQQKLSPLDQVQIIAYGTTTKRLSTGSISTVKAADIEKQPVTNVLQALQGRVPGLMIEQSTGLPGGSFSVRIRGQNNIGGFGKTFDPLYVIDGVPFNAQLTQRSLNASLTNLGNVSALNFLNPKDIESIEILKDADATSIYGSRAANGAILITTKKAKVGAMKLDVDVYTGTTIPRRQIKVLNTKQYLEVRREAFKNDNQTFGPADYDINGTWDTTRYTNWGKEIEQNPSPFANIQASVSGGNELNRYLIRGGYSKQTTGYPRLVKGDGADQSGSLHFNINSFSRDKRFELMLTTSYQTNKNTVSSVPSNIAMFLAPDAPPIYNADGTLNWAPKVPGKPGTFLNPFANFNRRYEALTSNLRANTSLRYTIVKGLEIKSNFGFTSIRSDQTDLAPTTLFDPAYKVASGLSNFQTGNTKSWIIEPQLNYHLQLLKSNLNFLFGSTFQENNTHSQTINATGFANNALLGSMQNASSLTKGGGANSQYKYTAFLGRVNYNFQNKYLLNINIRRDGSSRFGSGKQIHTFASLGGAYIFTEEFFFKKKVSFLSFGKLRGSYGTTGSDSFADYQFIDLYFATTSDVAYQGINGLYPRNQYNPDLRWEEKKSLDLALELGFFKNRIIVEANYYRNRSGNQLVSSPLSTVSGFVSVAQNLPALVQNSGVEAVVSTTNVRTKNFRWMSSFNISSNKNKLVKYPGLETSVNKNLLIIGKPLSIIKAFNYAGVNTATGLYQFRDSKGNLTSTPNDPADKTELIDVTPKYFGGLQNTVDYKGFSLSFLFQFVNQIAQNVNGALSNTPGQVGNVPVIFLDRWQKPGDQATYQKYSAGYNNYTQYYYATQSRWAYSSSSYIRLKNVAFSWSLPDNWLNKVRVQNGSIYIQGQNLLTLTNYKGFDPETRGVSLPPLQVWTIGLKASL
jgi:TonB-dependent starch-binding outer membrane protein SusC